MSGVRPGAAANRPEKRWLKAFRVASAFVLAGSIADLAVAQPVPDAGTTLRQLEPPTLTLPRKPPPGVEVEKPARPVLKPAPAVRFLLNGFRITGATVFPQAELLQVVQEFVSREVDIADLGEAVGRLTRFYFERGYPLATAYLPVQDIQGGIVELVMIEGRFGAVELLNRSRVRDPIVAAHVEGVRGRVVEDTLIERTLLLVYDLAGVVPARAVLRPGQAIGETDLRVELDAPPAATGSIELDNYGNRFNGADQLSGQLELASPAGLGDWLGARLTKGDPGLEYGRASYLLPLGSDGMRLGASYSNVRYQLGQSFAALGARGEGRHASVWLSYPLLRGQIFSLHGRAGAERKKFEDRISATATDTERASRLLTLALYGSSFDSLGGGGASAFSLNYSGGELDIRTPAAKAIDDASARTAGGFNKWTVSFVRLQNLAEPASLHVSLLAQRAGKNLDSSEKLVLGGPQGVRAYPQGEAAGDSGYLLSAELRYGLKAGALPGDLTLALFLDSGQVRINEEPFAAGANRRRLSAAGAALHWAKTNDFSVRMMLAQRIGDEPAIAGSDRKSRLWLQAVKNF